MAVRTRNRLPLSHRAAVARAETKFLARAIGGFVRRLVPIVAWGVASIVLGLIVGLAAVILPPLGSFAIVAAVGLVLLWVMPELPLVWPGIIRKTFFMMLIADLCIPGYYTIQISDLPWISARRLATFALIVPFVLAIAASSDVRRQIAERLRGSLLISICAGGFLVMAALSIGSSALPSDSFSALIDAIMAWYTPALAMIYVIRDKEDVVFILKIIAVCAVFNTTAGLVSFYLQHRFFLDIFPLGMLNALIRTNPALHALLPAPEDFRNGMYRSPSTFLSQLSFGEFEIIAIPIGLFFAAHRKDVYERTLGWVVVVGGILGIFSSGSRGGWVGVIPTVAVFVAFWSIRKAVSHRGSLGPAIAGLAGAISLVAVIGLIIVWPKAHNIVLGGSAEAGSTEARYIQWVIATPFIKSNPITGHGFVLGGYIINGSIDSYVISLLIETGIPGFVFFTGMLLLPIWYGLRNYLADLSETGAVAGALACSFIAFTINRLVLSERENHMLIFSLLGIVIYLNYEYAKKRVAQQRTSRLEVKSRMRNYGQVGEPATRSTS
jgi:O-antigen ligase